MIRILRVGGSLLTWDRLPSRLLRFLAAQSPATNVLVAGGGAWVDLLRESAQQFHLTEHDAHWLSVRAMSLTAQLLSKSTGIPLVDDLFAINCKQPGEFVFDTEAFLRHDEPQNPGIPLPCSWDATSDSIAARVAQALHADELVVLKSRDCPTCDDLESLANCGFADSFFPTAAKDVESLRFVNLRNFLDVA